MVQLAIQPDETVLWRGMTRPELDAAYNNAAASPEGAARLPDWTARSAAIRAAAPSADLDLVYGARERNRIDIFRCGQENAPLFVFIHGGYWQRNSKDAFSFVAPGPLAHGMDVALVGYTLAPEATLTEIVAEIRDAIHWLRREGPPSGIAKRRLVLSGWSAGGHLTASALDMPEVDAGLPISGVFDVEPCRLNYLNEKLNLSASEAEAQSPILHLPAKAGPILVTYGGRELPELQRQSQAYHAAWTEAGLQGTIRGLADHDHFSILDELASPDGQLSRAARDL